MFFFYFYKYLIYSNYYKNENIFKKSFFYKNKKYSKFAKSCPPKKYSDTCK